MNVSIIGMGPAGVTVVKTLRENRFNDQIEMFSTEKAPPYSPPALGAYLVSGNNNILFRDGKDFCERYNVICHFGEKIKRIIPEKRQIKSQNNSVYTFDYLVIASGASLYSPVKGSNKGGIYDFKTLGSANKIREIAQDKKNKTAVIVGGSFIGVEIALCLAKIGIKPLLLNRRGWIMPRLLDVETSKYVEKDLRAKGVEVMLNTEGEEFVGNKDVEYLLTTDGKKLKADIYITATGARPNTGFLKNTDIECDIGIVVNEKLQTKYPYIYACGDVAETIDFLSNKSKIHGLFPVAVNHAKTVAFNILGRNRKYERQINMNSLKELRFKIITVGNHDGEEIKFKTKDVLRKIYIRDSRITGFVLLGDISKAGIYLFLLKKREDIARYKDIL